MAPTKPANAGQEVGPPKSASAARNVAPPKPVNAGQQVAAPAKRKKVGPGSVIEHAKYGRGTVLRLEGSGDDCKVTVSFPGYGLKKLVAKYAGIKIE